MPLLYCIVRASASRRVSVYTPGYAADKTVLLGDGDTTDVNSSRRIAPWPGIELAR